jgi:glycosyltransferase involved in cell wall biosynthesis
MTTSLDCVTSAPEVDLANDTMKRPLRVLHILGRLGHGGVEVWLMNMIRALDHCRFQSDFLVHSHEPAPYDEEARQLGSHIFMLDPPRNHGLSYGRQLAGLLKEQGPFDVVHSHVHFFSGYNLRIAASRGVKVRIAHSHNDERGLTSGKTGLMRQGYVWLMKRWIKRYATMGLACSSLAAASLFGERWQEDSRFRVLKYGVDFSRFAALDERGALRRQLGLPQTRRILGQVGRLVYQKNHAFTVRVLEELIQLEHDAHLLLVGAGELEQSIRAQLDAAGLADRATLVGDQHDVAPYLGAMDCMIFPSYYEGLGIVALEAQAAGIPVVASDHVPKDVDVIPSMVEHLPLASGARAWAEMIGRRFNEEARDSRLTATQMAESEFGIDRAVKNLSATYEAGLKTRCADTFTAEPTRDGV